MLRQACVSTFKFAGLAFLGMNVRPKPAGPASTAGDLGSKIEERVAAATAATVPLVDPSAQPLPAPPVGSPSTSGGPDPSGGLGSKPQGDNPNPQMANPIGGSANPEKGAPGPSVDPQAPTPPSAGGGSSGPVPPNPTRKTTQVWGYPMFYKYTNHVVFYSADRSKNKDTNQATTNHVACPSQGCIDKKDGSTIESQVDASNNKPPLQQANVSQANKSPAAGSASGSDLVTIIEDLVADAAAGQLGGKIVEEVAVVATHVATDLGNKIVEGVTTVVAAIAPLDVPEGSDNNPKPGPQLVANPIGGSATPEEGTAPGSSVDGIVPPAGGSSGPASTSPTRNPLDPYDKYNHQAMFNIPDQSGTKATNQAGAGPSQDATTAAAAGDKKDHPEGSIPPQDGASNKPPQQATVVVSQADESQPAQQPHPDAIIRQYAREAWDISKMVILGYAAGFCMSF